MPTVAEIIKQKTAQRKASGLEVPVAWPIEEVFAVGEADSAEHDRQLSAYHVSPPVGKAPDNDGYIRYAFPKPVTVRGRNKASTRNTTWRPHGAKQDLTVKYYTEADQVGLFHYDPHAMEEDILEVCPYSLQQGACPKGMRCTLIPVCFERRCEDSRTCGKPHMRALCPNVWVHHGRDHRWHCAYVHIEDLEALAENLKIHVQGRDEDMELLGVKEGGWVSAVLRARR